MAKYPLTNLVVSGVVLTIGCLLAVSPLNASIMINPTGGAASEGVTNDQFDVSQGTIVIANSPMTGADPANGHGPSTPEAALGGTTPTFAEPTHTIFSDAPRDFDYIEFETATPIVLTSYDLYLTNDGDTTFRGATGFTLLGGTTADNVTTVIDSDTFSGNYVEAYNSSSIQITDNLVGLPGFQFFEIQLVRADTNSGPHWSNLMASAIQSLNQRPLCKWQWPLRRCWCCDAARG